jgi:hypothetical protein
MPPSKERAAVATVIPHAPTVPTKINQCRLRGSAAAPYGVRTADAFPISP